MSDVAVIIENGRSDWSVVLVTSGSAACQFAADELTRYLRQISGAVIPVGESGQRAIVVGLRHDLPTADRELLPDSSVGFDGFSLRITPGRVVIAGDNERGLIYGVYELLERVGCRWFYPQQDPADTEVVPRLRAVTLQPASYSIASPLQYRICNATSFFFEVEPDVMKKQLDAAMKARYNGMGWQCDHRTPVGDQYEQMVEGGVIAEIKKRGMLLHGPAHSYPHFLPNEHFEKHPEWFGMRQGKRVEQKIGGSQFCLSNAQARRKFIDNAEEFVLACPGLDVFCPLPFDGGPFCECSECSRSTPADLIYVLMNELIERLQVTAPRVMVETYGAYNPKDPPKLVKPHEKLRVIWAHWGRYHGFGYDDPRYEMRENLEKWHRAAPGGFTLCQYYTDNFATPWISAPYTIVIKGDRRYILERKIPGIYVLMWAKGYWWNHGFNAYMAGRCFYDVSLNPYDVLWDYCPRYYGEDAGPLLAAYYGQWAREIDLCYHVKDGTMESERAMLAEQRRLWIEPALAAVKGDRLLTHRVGKVAKLHEAAERLAELHRRRDKIRQLRTDGRTEEAAALLEKAESQADEVIAYLAELAALNQGLIDKNEVPGFITLGVKGWIGEERKALKTAEQ